MTLCSKWGIIVASSHMISALRGLKRTQATNSGSPERGFKRALTLFYEASRRVPAYKDFLRKNKVKAEKILTEEDFTKLPLVDKKNYISQYSLEELSWDGTLNNAQYISTSSGSTGEPFFWPRGFRQDVAVGIFYQQILEKIFGTKNSRTLVVDSFALGAWIAGLEFYNAAKWIAEHGNQITIITPGIEKKEAINQIKKLSPNFDKIILVGYPPFVKDILEEGVVSGIPWKKKDVYLLTAGEAISEKWRKYTLSIIGKENSLTGLINVYGMAESGVVAHETPLSILFRQKFCSGLPDSEKIVGCYQYYPMMKYFEIDRNKTVVLTSDAGLPLIRYDTRDTGGILNYSDIIKIGELELKKKLAQHEINPNKLALPLIYLYGRKDLSVSLYALQIYVENLKQTLESAPFSPYLSGLFTMGVTHNRRLNQSFEIIIELARNKKPNLSFAKEITNYTVKKLCQLNSEYSKLHKTIGKKAMPHIKLVKYGEINTVPGRKHKWIKR